MHSISSFLNPHLPHSAWGWFLFIRSFIFGISSVVLFFAAWRKAIASETIRKTLAYAVMCGLLIVICGFQTRTFTGVLNGVRYADQFPGADMGAKVNAAYADLPSRTVSDGSGYFTSITAPFGTIEVTLGAFSYSTGIVINSPFVNVRGQGTTSTELDYTGSGTAIWFEPCSTCNYSEFVSGNGLFNLSINGNGASAGAVGLRTTDFSGFRLDNVAIKDFSGTGSIGWLDDTLHLYNEKMTITRLGLINNKVSWEISPAIGSAGCSLVATCATTFGYGIFDVAILNHQGQTGLLMVNGNLSYSTIKMTFNQVDTTANATAIQLQNNANFGPNNYMLEIESPQGIGTGHEINISSNQSVPFAGIGPLVQGAMSSNITGITQGGNTQFLPPQDGLWWPIFKTAGSTTSGNPVFRLDPNAPNQARLNIIDVLAVAPSGYQTNTWPTASGQIANLNAAQTFTANQTFSTTCPTLFFTDTTPGIGKAIAVCSGELHVTDGGLTTNLLALTDTGTLKINARASGGAGGVIVQGNVCTNGELTLSAGWQSTGSASVTAVQGQGQTCSWTITTGTTTAANPTVTDTLTNVLPSASVVCEMNIHGGSHTAIAGEYFQQTTLSATAPVFTFQGTPTAGGTTYFVTRRCGP